jgi:hypothetical protein
MAVRIVERPDELASFLDTSVSDFGAPLTDPIFLVCTNGKRDACCALRGRAVTAAMAAEHAERMWECTHLGGHRFAGNLVCLPHGIVYGRVGPAAATGLADAYLGGHVAPDHLRGRSAWPPPAQVAEQVLRQRMGLNGIDDVRLVENQVDGESASVVLAASGAEHRFVLRTERGEPRPTSCRADELEEPMHWVVVES